MPGAVAWIFVAAVLFSAWAVTTGWTNTIVDAHGFRQTQTAISTYYMLHGSGVLAYETPLLGPPWSIPFEFPLYQVTVALAVRMSRLDLEPAGRLVSVAFFYLTLIPAADALRTLGMATRHRLICLALLLVSPLYLFWSRTFMIESTALFLAVAYLALLMRCARAGGGAVWMAAAMCGCLAGVVKLTTLYACWMAGAAYVAWSEHERGLDRRRIFVLATVLALPVTVSLGWTRHADAQRALNPFADFLRAPALTPWMFGTVEQRLTAYPTWWAIGVRTIESVCGSLAFYLTVPAMLWSRLYRRPYAACVALYLAAVMTFTNLYVVHEYYPYSIGIFLIAAEGFAIASLLEGDSRQRLTGIALAVFLIGSSAWAYAVHEHRLQRGNSEGRTTVARQIASMTQPDEVLVIFGLDWSAEVPYYARRRALMIQEPERLTRESVEQARAAVRAAGFRLGPFIECNVRGDVLRAQSALWGFDGSRPAVLYGCRLFR